MVLLVGAQPQLGQRLRDADPLEQGVDRLDERLRTLGRRYAFVLSQIMPSSPARAEEAAAALVKSGPLAPVIVAARADYQDAMLEGMGVTEYAPSGKAAGEIRDLWTWTKKELAR